MDLYKYVLDFLDKAGPTIATVIAVFLAYKFAIRQKRFDSKDEESAKIRSIISNLLSIWQQLAQIKKMQASNIFYTDLLLKNPNLVADYFGLDLIKIKRYKEMFHDSIKEIKSINVRLYTCLEVDFDEFEKFFDYLDSNQVNSATDIEGSRNIDFKMLNQVTEDMEIVILETSDYLRKKERKEIKSIISQYSKEKNDEFSIEIPKFLLDLINENLPIKEPITADEFKLFMNDATIKMIMGKIIPFFSGVFLQKNLFNTISMVYKLAKEPEKFEGLIDLDQFVLSFNMTEAENELFRKNIGFYKIICQIYKKFDSRIPISFIRTLLQINNGTINLREELLKIQKTAREEKMLHELSITSAEINNSTL